MSFYSVDLSFICKDLNIWTLFMFQTDVYCMMTSSGHYTVTVTDSTFQENQKLSRKFRCSRVSLLIYSNTVCVPALCCQNKSDVLVQQNWKCPETIGYIQGIVEFACGVPRGALINGSEWFFSKWIIEATKVLWQGDRILFLIPKRAVLLIYINWNLSLGERQLKLF